MAAATLAKPDTFRVERSTRIKASPEKIFPFINSFRRWVDWSPYENLDPQIARTYGGPDAGVGAAYAWEGKKAGSGRMEILESSPGLRVVIQLDFSKPMKAHNTAEFTLETIGDSTKVTWAMSGPNTVMSKVMKLFFSMDKLVGKDFEAGLANLKARAEA